MYSLGEGGRRDEAIFDAFVARAAAGATVAGAEQHEFAKRLGAAEPAKD